MSRLITFGLKYSVLATFVVIFIGISTENVQGQTSNATEEFEDELRMEQQELEEQLQETIESFNQTQKLEGIE